MFELDSGPGTAHRSNSNGYGDIAPCATAGKTMSASNKPLYVTEVFASSSQWLPQSSGPADADMQGKSCHPLKSLEGSLILAEGIDMKLANRGLLQALYAKSAYE